MLEDRIRVTGTAVRVVQPDVAKIVVRVREIDADPRAAHDRCAPRVEAVTTGLRELLGDAGHAAARAVTVRRHWPEMEQERRELHEAVCRIVAECPADQAGRVLAGAIRLGADEAGRVEYGVSDRDAIHETLLAEAVEVARRKAGRLAEAAGRPLGAVVTLKEPPDAEYGAMAASTVVELSGGGDDEIELEPSEIRLAKSVRVTFALG